MIKVITVLRHKPGMDLVAFTEYWQTTHAYAVKRIDSPKAAKIDGLNGGAS